MDLIQKLESPHTLSSLSPLIFIMANLLDSITKLGVGLDWGWLCHPVLIIRVCEVIRKNSHAWAHLIL